MLIYTSPASPVFQVLPNKVMLQRKRLKGALSSSMSQCYAPKAMAVIVFSSVKKTKYSMLKNGRILNIS